MRWIAISGGWRKTNKEIEKKVRNFVQEIIKQGDGVVSGGALEVDLIVLDEALKYDPKAKKIKAFLPTTLKVYAEHYRKHALLGTITNTQVETLINQLTKLKEINPKALIENPDTNFTENTKRRRYYERNSSVVEAANELIAFRVRTKESRGMGVADTVLKARKKGIPVRSFQYDFTKEQIK